MQPRLAALPPLTNLSPADVQFIGFVSDVPVSASLYIHYPNLSPTMVLTNFEAFGPAPVPEPRTWLLVGLGLLTFAPASAEPEGWIVRESRGAVPTMSTGSRLARASRGPSNTMSASAPCCVSTRWNWSNTRLPSE